MGKTAVLQKIHSGYMGDEYATAYVDLADTNPDSMSQFLWGIATIFAPQLRVNGDTPTLHRSDCVANPQAAFEATLLLPKIEALNGRHLILLFDNFHILQRRFADGGLSYDDFAQWQQQLQELPQLHTIFTISDGDDDRLVLFDRAHRYRIEPMVSSAACDLVRAHSSYTFYSDVAKYIGEASGGNPRTIINVMRALKNQQQDDPHRQPTVADVAALRIVSPETSIPVRPIYEVSERKTAVNNNTQRSRQIKQVAALFTALFIISTLLWAIFRPVQRTRVTTAAGMAVGLITPTMTHTPYPIIDYAATPRITRVTVTPRPTETHTPIPTSIPTATPSPMPPTSTPSPTILPDEFVRESDGMVMLLIPAGSFMMGGRENDYAASPDERPLHEVQLDSYYMDKYEVSLAQYAAFINKQIGAGGVCDAPETCVFARQDASFSFLDKQDVGDGSIQYFPLAGYSDYPANNISWFGAAAYCDYVNGRLPTEAEWEYAARGDDGRLYPWGDAYPNETRTVFNSESFDNLLPVDSLPDGASAFGIYGMAGSMWEWTADWYDDSYYKESPLLNPQGAEHGFTRVIRGGAWPYNNQADRIRSSNRNDLAPDQLQSIVGFRCVRDQ